MAFNKAYLGNFLSLIAIGQQIQVRSGERDGVGIGKEQQDGPVPVSRTQTWHVCRSNEPQLMTSIVIQ